MSTPTPEPNYSDLVETVSLVAPRLDLMLREMKRRLRGGIPQMVAAANALNATDNGVLYGPYAFDGKPLKSIAGVRYGGTPLLEGKATDWVYLALQNRKVPVGMAREFDSLTTLSIFVLGESQEVDGQGEMALARAGLIERYLHEFLGGCCDPQGRKVWHDLIPQGSGSLPEQFGAYSGETLVYQVRLTPNTY